MRNLWQDIQAHKLAAVLFLAYWLSTLVVIHITWDEGIPFPVVLLSLTLPLIAGILVGLSRYSTPERTTRFSGKSGGGILAGLLCTEITLLVMKGGVVDEVIGWMRGWKFFGQWGEVVGFILAAGVFGIILGFIGAVLASVIERLRHRLTTHS